MSGDVIENTSLSPRTAAPAVHLAREYTFGSLVVTSIVAALMVALGIVVARNPYFRWPVFAEYFFSAPIIAGIRMTLSLTVVTMIVATIIGTLIATMRLSRNPILMTSGFLYCWALRGIPELVQLFFWYNFALLFKYLGFQIGDFGFFVRTNTLMTPFVAATIALSLCESAYIAEIVRGGVLSVSHGQIEAARSLGMTRGEALSRIIIPQALRALLPPMGNQLIGLLKWTSIASIVGVTELMLSAELIYSRTFETIPLLVVAAVWYLIITTIISIAQRPLERRYADPSHH